jgi:hypothetical protein
MNEKHFDKQRLFFKNLGKHLKWYALFYYNEEVQMPQTLL